MSSTDSVESGLPTGWCVTELSHVVPKAQYGISSSLDEESGIPVLRMNNLHDGAIDISDVKFSTSPEAERLLLRQNDVLFNRTNSIEHVGRTSLWRGELPIASFASYLVRLIPDPSRLDAEYLVRWLNLPEIQIAIRCFATPGVHQANINPTNLRKTEMRLPEDVREQKKINKILATVDSLIEKAKALIAKYQAIKQGMMHDLFTRGLDEHGHLRPSCEESPELYKQSELGWIPREWDCVPLAMVVPNAQYGISVSLDDSEGVPVLRMNNLGNGVIDVTDIKRSQHPEARRLFLKDRDVLFNRTNSIEHVGRTSIWKDELPGSSFASYLVRLVPNPARLTPEYLVYWLNRPEVQIAIRQFATPGVHQVNINPTNLRKSLIVVPSSLREQAAITQIVQQQEKQVGKEQLQLAKLSKQKTGLMQDLLTGNIRVKVDEAEEVAASA